GGWRSKGKGGGDGTFVPGKGMRAHEELVAASNPALGGWRSKGKGGGDGTFVPGKGMRAHEELVAASNPALGGWRSKGKGGGDGTFVPGLLQGILLPEPDLPAKYYLEPSLPAGPYPIVVKLGTNKMASKEASNDCSSAIS
ncbi:hypothetical protein ACHAXR_000914, partial [Thalassiosira sp. AJA248-18]